MKNQKGFTLIELVIVIAIIGTLAIIAIPQFQSYKVRGFDADTKSALRNSMLDQEAYYTEYEMYTHTPHSSLVANISFVITADSTTYHMEAKHHNSPNWYFVDQTESKIKRK